MIKEHEHLTELFYKQIEKNSSNIEHLSVTVAVMSKQYDDIQEKQNEILAILQRLEQRLEALEKERIKEQGKKEAKTIIIEHVVKYWWVGLITIIFFVANDTNVVERIKAFFGK